MKRQAADDVGLAGARRRPAASDGRMCQPDPIGSPCIVQHAGEGGKTEAGGAGLSDGDRSKGWQTETAGADAPLTPLIQAGRGAAPPSTRPAAPPWRCAKAGAPDRNRIRQASWPL